MDEFRAPITAADRGGAYVVVPPEVVEALGGGGRIPCARRSTVSSTAGSVASMGGEKVLGVLKAIREELGKGPGDVVVVTLARDDAPRTVSVTDDLGAALEAAGRRAAFDALSYSHQREYVEWIDEAKRADSRRRRIGKAVDQL